MPKKRDENETAFDTLQEILRRDAERDGISQPPTPKPEKVSYRVKAGRKGGKIGGKARAKLLSAKTRNEMLRKPPDLDGRIRLSLVPPNISVVILTVWYNGAKLQFVGYAPCRVTP